MKALYVPGPVAKETGRAMNGKGSFRIGSTTRIFTVSATLAPVDLSEVSKFDLIAKWFSGFPGAFSRKF